MKNMSKSIKFILLLIVFLIILMIVLYIVNKFFILPNKKIEISNNTESQIEVNKLGNQLVYQNNPNEFGFDIYTKDGEFITTVYSMDDLEFYEKHPDYRPSSNPVERDYEPENIEE